MEKEKEVWREIFDLYRDMPCLWDISHTNYMNKDTRNQAYELLMDKYKLFDEGATISILKKKLDNMRTSYKTELKKVKASMGTGTGTDNIYVPTLWYYELLTFLDEKNEQSRRGTDTMENSDEENTQQTRQQTTPTPQLPPAKKQRTNLVKKQKDLYEMASKLLNSPEAEWEIYGKSIGLQMKDIDQRQHVILQKLISDAIFYAKLGRLTEESSISIRALQPMYLSSRSAGTTPTPPYPMPSPSMSRQSFAGCSVSQEDVHYQSHQTPSQSYVNRNTLSPPLTHTIPSTSLNVISNVKLPTTTLNASDLDEYVTFQNRRYQ